MILSWKEKFVTAQICCVLQYKINFFIFRKNFKFSFFFDPFRTRTPLLATLIKISFSHFSTPTVQNRHFFFWTNTTVRNRYFFSLSSPLWYEIDTFFCAYHVTHSFFRPLSYDTLTFAHLFLGHSSFSLPPGYETHTFFCIYSQHELSSWFFQTLSYETVTFLRLSGFFYLAFITTLVRNAYFQLFKLYFSYIL